MCISIVLVCLAGTVKNENLQLFLCAFYPFGTIGRSKLDNIYINV